MKRKILIAAAIATMTIAGLGAGNAAAIPLGISGTVHATPCKWWC